MSNLRLTDLLSKARDSAKVAEKDAVNQYHRYQYASAESVITAAREGLAGTGVSLIPVETRLSKEGNEWIISRRWILAGGDEAREISLNWPVLPEKGRPLDKALASALTSSLAYLLRDLLLIPRLTEDYVDGRADRPAPDHDSTPADEKESRIGRMVNAFHALGISSSALEEYLGKSPWDLTEDEIDRLREIYRALSAGEMKWGKKGPEPVQPEPVQPGPISRSRPEPIQPEPAQPKPAQSEPVRPESVQSEPTQPDPKQILSEYERLGISREAIEKVTGPTQDLQPLDWEILAEDLKKIKEGRLVWTSDGVKEVTPTERLRNRLSESKSESDSSSEHNEPKPKQDTQDTQAPTVIDAIREIHRKLDAGEVVTADMVRSLTGKKRLTTAWLSKAGLCIQDGYIRKIQ